MNIRKLQKLINLKIAVFRVFQVFRVFGYCLLHLMWKKLSQNMVKTYFKLKRTLYEPPKTTMKKGKTGEQGGNIKAA